MNIDYFYLCVFASAELQRSLSICTQPTRLSGSRTAPRGSHFWLSTVLLKGHLGPLESSSASISSSGGDGDCSCRADCVCERERERECDVCSVRHCCLFVSHLLVCWWGRKRSKVKFRHQITLHLCFWYENQEAIFDNILYFPRFTASSLVFFFVFFQAPIIPVVFSSYSNFYLRKQKQFKSGNSTWLSSFFSFKYSPSVRD